MRKVSALAIRSIVLRECKRQNIPYLPSIYRRAKKNFASLSWIRKTIVLGL